MNQKLDDRYVFETTKIPTSFVGIFRDELIALMDLYFEKNYGKLYEEIENGTCEVFIFDNQFGKIRHLFIKKEIPHRIQGEAFFDIVTPYGYGGPLIIEAREGAKRELVQAFETAFQHYCLDSNIVCEFVRFHPIFLNALDFINCYKVVHHRKTTGTNLADFEAPFQEEFSKSTRKSIQKALKAGVEYNIIVNPPSLKNFQNIYHQTMKRLGADDIYFFDDTYFSECLKYFGKNIVLVEVLYEKQVIGMEMHFIYNDVIHTHLSGTLDGYHHLSPVYVMTYAIAKWGKENGFKLIHSGGGRSGDPEDSLFQFKKKFGKNTEFDYYVGYRIWNRKIYKALCELSGTRSTDETFFPAYRKKLKAET